MLSLVKKGTFLTFSIVNTDERIHLTFLQWSHLFLVLLLYFDDVLAPLTPWSSYFCV